MAEVLRIHYLQHVPFEGPANIDNWAESRSTSWPERGCMRASPPPPDVAEFDWLVMMGGPMGANDDREHIWMCPEKALIEATVSAGHPVIGVCLGAQLIANVLGARVYRNAEKEIGWFPVRKATDLPSESPFSRVPETFTPLHWDGDTFDVPAGARRLASSEGCVSRAFEYHGALALQFQIEATKKSVDALVERCGDEIDRGPYQQDPEAIARCEAQVSTLEPILFGFLDQLAR